MSGEEFGGGSGELGAGLGFVGVGLGVFDEGGSGMYLTGEQAGCFVAQFWAKGGDFGFESVKVVSVEVPSGTDGGVAEFLAEVADFRDGRS